MSRSVESWYAKANAFSSAWLQRFQVAPAKGTVVLGLCVAEHETRCGDAWPGSHNWGATTRRMPTAAEKAAWTAAGVHPTINPASIREAAERAAIAALAAAGIDPGGNVVLHIDSEPTHGAYFTWFAKEPDDIAGANYFIGILARTAAEKTALAGASTYALADAMFRAKYYTGFHKDDPGTNIAAYASALAILFPIITLALASWLPGADPPQPAPYVTPAGFDLATVLGVQQALNWLQPTVHQLTEDGKMGPNTLNAIKHWQATHGLTVDGIAGPKTQASLRSALSP